MASLLNVISNWVHRIVSVESTELETYLHSKNRKDKNKFQSNRDEHLCILFVASMKGSYHELITDFDACHKFKSDLSAIAWAQHKAVANWYKQIEDVICTHRSESTRMHARTQVVKRLE